MDSAGRNFQRNAGQPESGQSQPEQRDVQRFGVEVGGGDTGEGLGYQFGQWPVRLPLAQVCDDFDQQRREQSATTARGIERRNRFRFPPSERRLQGSAGHVTRHRAGGVPAPVAFVVGVRPHEPVQFLQPFGCHRAGCILV